MSDFRNFVSIPNIFLYKYFGNIENAKKCILTNQIHLEKPSDYNDIYDSASITRPEDLKRKIMIGFVNTEVFNQYVKIKLPDEVVNQYRYEIIQNIIDSVCSKDKSINREEFIESTIQYLDRYGVLQQADNNLISCFSEINDSMLMWAYYAKNFTGVCLGFDFTKDLNLQKHIHKVQYTKYFQQESNFNGYFRKNIEWSHEQEWRIVHNGSNEYLSTTALSSVYLGYKIDAKVGNELIKIARDSGLKIYLMEPEKFEYKLKFIEI